MFGATFKLSKLSQKWLIFFAKKPKFLYILDHTIFAQISPAFGPSTFQIMHGETSDYQYQHQQW